MPATTSSTTLAVRALTLSVHAEAADGSVPEWIEIVPAGTFRGVDGRGPYVLKNPTAVIAASMPGSRPVPLDYNHQTVFACLNGGEAPAAAWIVAMEDRQGAIWAKLDWTEAGRQAVASKSYRFVSPAFQHDKKTGEVKRIDSVGLVNNPNLAELPAIASQNGDFPPMDELLKQLREALGLAADADQDSIVQCCRKLNGQTTAVASALAPVAATLKLAANASVADIATAAQTALTASGAPDPAQYVPMSAFSALQGQVAALTSAKTAEAAAQAVASAKAAGKLIPALEGWGMDYASRDLAGFTAWADKAPAIVAAAGTTTTTTGAPPAVVGALDADAMAVCAQLGLTADEFKKVHEESAQ